MTELEPIAEDNSKPSSVISRRQALLTMGAAATVAYTGAASAAMPGHNHSSHKPKHPEVLDATNACLDKGQRCIAHCLVSFVEGDLELAECASKVHEMQAICNAFSYLIAANSVYAKDYSSICVAACDDCAKVCREHDEHFECRDCAEACEDIIKAIKKSFA